MCGGIIDDKSFINGEFVDEKDAKVSYEDRGYVLEMVFMSTFVLMKANYLQ